MFTGIIESLGLVRRSDDGRIILESSLDDVRPGESIAVNGCCLTAIEAGPILAFDVSEETRARTALGRLTPGSRVNLERAMKADGRFGGHLVQGHVDGVAEIVAISRNQASTVFRFRGPEDRGRYLVDKGSVCLDGISLTVVDPQGPEFKVAVIPHTLAHTNLKDRQVGDFVNVEFDVLAKYVERLLAGRGYGD